MKYTQLDKSHTGNIWRIHDRLYCKVDILYGIGILNPQHPNTPIPTPTNKQIKRKKEKNIGRGSKNGNGKFDS